MRRVLLAVRFPRVTVENVVRADGHKDDAAVARVPCRGTDRRRIDRKGLPRLVLASVDVVKCRRVDEHLWAKIVESAAHCAGVGDVAFVMRWRGDLAIA